MTVHRAGHGSSRERYDPLPSPDPARTGTAPSADLICPNCGSWAIRRYCSDCGQAVPSPADYSFRAHVADLVRQLTSMDGKTGRTLRTLVARPGELTVDHLLGRRARYLGPLQLFLLMNVLLFFAAPQVPLFSYSLEKYLRYAPPSPALVTGLVQRATPHGHTHAPDAGGAAYEAYEKVFDARVEAQRKGLVILFAPALALLLRALFGWRSAVPGVPRRFGEHLVFALHTLAFVWLLLAGMGGIARMAGEVLIVSRPDHAVLVAGVLLLLLWAALYVLHAVRCVYRLSWPRTIVVLGIIGVASTGFLLLYRGLLFFTTYYTL